MNSHHVTELLPLWVGGDLTDRDALAVEAHLRQCAACRAVADSLGDSRQWLLGGTEAPYTAEERMAFRNAVMTQIRAEAGVRRAPRFNRTSRPWLLAAAALLLAMGTHRLAKRPSPVEPPFTPTPVAGVAPGELPLPRLPVRAEARHRLLRPRRLVPEAPSPEAPTFARLELQTSDPSIRIIWLARATPASAPSEPSHP
jgi:anti-sigma factor RsiW